MSITKATNEGFLHAVNRITLDASSLEPIEGQRHMWQRPLGPQREDEAAHEAYKLFKEDQPTSLNKTVVSIGMKVLSISDPIYMWIQGPGGLYPGPNRMIVLIIIPPPCSSLKGAQGSVAAQAQDTYSLTISPELDSPEPSTSIVKDIGATGDFQTERHIDAGTLQKPAETWFHLPNREHPKGYELKKCEWRTADIVIIPPRGGIYLKEGGFGVIATRFDVGTA